MTTPTPTGGGLFWPGLSSVGNAPTDDDSNNESTTPMVTTAWQAMLAKRPAPDELIPSRRTKKRISNIRVPGGHAPTFKPVTVDLDEEDQIIVDMKQKGFSDEAIAKRLIENGMTKYEPKSIQCRWVRIRRKTEQYNEALLDEELTDWHVGEDEMLREAVENANKQYDVELEKLEQKKWKWAADEINKKLSRPRFSGRACQERFHALETGTARCPPELDSDPEGRAREREQKLALFKQRKQEEAEQAAAEAAEKQRIKRENTAQKIAARERKEARGRIKAQKIKEEEDYRQAKADAAEQTKQRRQTALENARESRKYNEEKHRVFTALLKKLRQEAAARERKQSKLDEIIREGLPTEEAPARKKHAFQSNREQLESEKADIEADNEDTLAGILARDHQFQGPAPGVRALEPAETDAAIMSSNAHSTADEDVDPTPDIWRGEDPRNFLTISELWDLMRSRRMILNRMKEGKAVMLSRIRADDEHLKIGELQDWLRKRNAPTDGPKAVLIRRLREEDGKTSKRYRTLYTTLPLDIYGRPIKPKDPIKPLKTKRDPRYSALDPPDEETPVEPAVRTSALTYVRGHRKRLSNEFVYTEDEEEVIGEARGYPIDTDMADAQTYSRPSWGTFLQGHGGSDFFHQQPFEQ